MCAQFDAAEHLGLREALAKGAATPKVIDFGMAKRLQQNKTHASVVGMGATS